MTSFHLPSSCSFQSLVATLLFQFSMNWFVLLLAYTNGRGDFGIGGVGLLCFISIVIFSGI